MEDGELRKIASDFGSLSEAAQDVLRAEMAKRELPPPHQMPTIAAIADDAKTEVQRPTPQAQADPGKSQILRRYRDITEALVARSVLDSAGIESYLADENTVRMHWLWSDAVGGIKLLARHEDMEAANKLLDEATLEAFDLSGVGEYQQPKCPKCGSMDVTLGESDQHMKVAGFIVGLPLSATSQGWVCHACKNRWDDEERPQSADPASLP